MKRALRLSFYISVICFGLVTYLTGTFEASFDGHDIIGWPINFYDKCGDCINIITQKADSSNNFNFLYFLIDYIIIFAAIYTLITITKKPIKE